MQSIGTMMKKTMRAMAVVAMVALMAACDDKPEHAKEYGQFTLNATIEPLDGDSTEASGGAKTYLRRERWIVWELGDMVNLASNSTASTTADGFVHFAELMNASAGGDFEDYAGMFLTSMPYDSRHFLGLFPYSENTYISQLDDETGLATGAVTIDLPAVQPVRNDSTFTRSVFPMAAWYRGDWNSPPYTPHNFDFHSLAGVVRVQLFSSTGTTDTLRSITFTEQNGRQLVGRFTVSDYNTYNPYLTSLDNTAANQQLTVRFAPTADSVLEAHKLLSFYVVLPSTGGMSAKDDYRLKMTVLTSSGKSSERTFSVPIRRNGITYLDALEIKDWFSASGNGPGIVGNGTEERPFKIYTIGDLRRVRDAFANPEGGKVYVNGLQVTRYSYFRVMRSDIELDDANWTSGIPNFAGRMDYYGTGSSTPGITNHSNAPLFESVSDSGHVEGLTVKVTEDHVFSPVGTDFSLFCYENRGTLKDCRIMTTSSGKIRFGNKNFGGVCVNNEWEMKGCGSLANIEGNGHVAGVCLKNNSAASWATMEGCYAASMMNIAGASAAAGVCYENGPRGTVRGCYFASRMTASNCPWGGVVYTNSGQVSRCYISSTATIVTTAAAGVGGIVNTNTDGSLTYCWCEAILKGRLAGGIVATFSGGSVVNCFIDSRLSMVTLSTDGPVAAGGLVGTMSGGVLTNSFVYTSQVQRDGTAGDYGGVVGALSGGTVGNCYSYEVSAATRRLYGSKSGSAAVGHCYVVNLSSPQDGVTSWATSDLSGACEVLDPQRMTYTDSYPYGYEWDCTGDHPVLNDPEMK